MIKTYIKIAVDIPTADPTSRLVIEPGTSGFVVLTNGSFKVGVDEQTLRDALLELELMKTRHSLYLVKEERTKEPELGEIIEGDEE